MAVPGIDRLFDELPPHSVEAECAMLGAIFRDSSVVDDVMEVVRDGSFLYTPKNRAVYDAIIRLHGRGDLIDLVTVRNEVGSGISDNQRDTVEHLITLIESVPSVVGAVHYAKIVREKHERRKLIDLAGRMLHAAYRGGDGPDEQIEAAQSELYRMVEGMGSSDKGCDMRELLNSLYDRLAAGIQRDDAVPTGYRGIDAILDGGGLQPGQVVVIGARSGVGKTSLALGMAMSMAGRLHPCQFFSMEMDGQQLARRSMSWLTGLSSSWMERQMKPSEYLDVAERIGGFRGDLLRLEEVASLRPSVVRNRVRRSRSLYKTKVVFIDYLQLMCGDGKHENKNVEIESITRQMKVMAMEYGVSVVLLSQLNRGVDNRENGRPRLSDLRSSGAIEQDADVVLMLHREDAAKGTYKGWVPNGEADVMVAKQRSGATGNVKMRFEGSTVRFLDVQDGQ